MTTAYTSLLGLALPVTGELSGTWGDTVNNAITSLLDTAVAGTTTLSTDGDVTLTTTTGASNQARQAILLCSGARTAARNITAPAQSKIYTVINATTGGYAVTIRGAGPTTGVTIPAGQTAQVAWNGSDFVDASNYVGGNLKVNGNLSVTGTTTLTGAATLTANPTLSAGTANGVSYLNASKVLTTGSALQFDGANLGFATAPSAWNAGNIAIQFTSGSSFSGLTGGYAVIGQNYYGASGSDKYIANGTASRFYLNGNTFKFQQIGSGLANGSITWPTADALQMDGNGQLSVGATLSNWNTGHRAIQFANSTGVNGSLFAFSTAVGLAYNYFNTAGGDYYAANGYISRYYQSGGGHYWNANPNVNSSGAGAVCTFSSAYNASWTGSGQFLIGTDTAPSGTTNEKLTVYSTTPFPLWSSTSSVGGSHFSARTTGVTNNILISNNGAYNYGVIGVNAGNSTSTGDVWQIGRVASATASPVGVLLWSSAANAIGLHTTPASTGTGITFPSAVEPSTDVNTLDDYEEGTFTPYISFGGGTTGIVYGAQKAQYVKIGRNVYVNLYIYLNNKGSSTGSAAINGFPFGLGSTSQGTIDFFIPMGVRGNINTGGSQVSLYSGSLNTTAFTFYQCDLTGGGNVGMNESQFKNNTEVNFNFWYQTND